MQPAFAAPTWANEGRGNGDPGKFSRDSLGFGEDGSGHPKWYCTGYWTWPHEGGNSQVGQMPNYMTTHNNSLWRMRNGNGIGFPR